jgi:uncharacterized protein YaiE (UPF0345 family)
MSRNHNYLNTASVGVMSRNHNYLNTASVGVMSRNHNYLNTASVGVMSVIHRGFYPQCGKTKDLKLVCVASLHSELSSKSKDWLAWSQDHVSEWSSMSSCGLISVR